MNNRSGPNLRTAHPTPGALSEALRRARTADAAVTRPARRTFAAMAPGSVRQPVLQLAPNVRFLPSSVWGDPDADVCPLCERWTRICGQNSTAPVLSGAALKAVA